MKRFLILGFILVLLSSAVFGAERTATGSAISVIFGTDTVTASGITPGKAAVFFATGLVAGGAADQLVMRWAQVVSDDDGDGMVQLNTGGRVPFVSVWAVVDLADGRYTLASPPGYYPRTIELPPNAFRRGGGSVVDQFGLNRPQVDLLYVHAGGGAWTWRAWDGGPLDRDGANGVTLLSLTDGKVLSPANNKTSEFAPGGVMVAIDWYNMEALAFRVTGAMLGGAR